MKPFWPIRATGTIATCGLLLQLLPNRLDADIDDIFCIADQSSFDRLLNDALLFGF